MNTITLPIAEYEDIIDARDHAIAMRDIAGGTPLLTEEEAAEYLDAPSPLTFWRKHRGLSQAALARVVGISQPYLAQLENGSRTAAPVSLYAALAREMSVRIEDLLSEEITGSAAE
jgi:DNA-binding XRE family transcriptional regulator